MARKPVEPVPTWRCPECLDTQTQRALQVSHRCPARQNQPKPEPGKRRRSEVVFYERVEHVR
jgi:hypothetical protein